MSKNIYVAFVFMLIVIAFIEPSYCAVTNDQIKAATKTFVGTINDWIPAIIAGGLFGSGICLFANNFKMGIAGLAGTGFLYAAKSFVENGEAALINIADQILQVM